MHQSPKVSILILKRKENKILRKALAQSSIKRTVPELNLYEKELSTRSLNEKRVKSDLKIYPNYSPLITD